MSDFHSTCWSTDASNTKVTSVFEILLGFTLVTLTDQRRQQRQQLHCRAHLKSLLFFLCGMLVKVQIKKKSRQSDMRTSDSDGHDEVSDVCPGLTRSWSCCFHRREEQALIWSQEWSDSECGDSSRLISYLCLSIKVMCLCLEWSFNIRQTIYDWETTYTWISISFSDDFKG